MTELAIIVSLVTGDLAGKSSTWLVAPENSGKITNYKLLNPYWWPPKLLSRDVSPVAWSEETETPVELLMPALLLPLITINYARSGSTVYCSTVPRLHTTSLIVSRVPAIQNWHIRNGHHEWIH